MPGPGPTLTQLAQNVGEGVKASKILLEKLAQTNLFDCNLSFKPKSKLFSGSFLRPKHFPSPDNLPLTCRHSWTFMVGHWNLNHWWLKIPMKILMPPLLMLLGLLMV